jgi:hypothetical protein
MQSLKDKLTKELINDKRTHKVNDEIINLKDNNHANIGVI